METLEQAAQRFLRLATRLRRLGAQPASQGVQVSPAHLALMEVIAASPGCSLQQIAEALRLKPPTISTAVRQLERLGWVERQQHPTDRRTLQIYLTPDGEKVYQQALAFHRRKFERLLQGLNPEERKVLLDLLERAIQAAERSE